MKLFRGTSKKPFFRAYVRTFRTDAEKKIENAALFCNRYENRTFRKRPSNRRNLKTQAFRFRVDGRNVDNGAFRKPLRHDNQVIFLTKIFSVSNSTDDCMLRCQIC